MVIAENSRMLVRAGIAAAISPAGKKSQDRFRVYGEEVNKERGVAYNPLEYPLKKEFDKMVLKVLDEGNFTKDELLRFPWSARRLNSSRIAAGLMAFLDDQGKNIPTELFPSEKIHTFLNSVLDHYQLTGQPLSVLDQFGIALSQSNDNPVAASLLAHSAYRSIARSCDTRIDSKLNFPVISDGSMNMINMARATADFKTHSQKRDPLGDTYHFWAQFAANMTFSLLGKEKPISTRMYKTAFYFGPQLGSLIRDKTLGQKSQFGLHEEVDRQGYRIGTAVGKLLRSSTKERGKF